MNTTLKEYYSKDCNGGKCQYNDVKIPSFTSIWTKDVINIAESKLIIICDQEIFFDYLGISQHLIDRDLNFNET